MKVLKYFSTSQFILGWAIPIIISLGGVVFLKNCDDKEKVAFAYKIFFFVIQLIQIISVLYFTLIRVLPQTRKIDFGFRFVLWQHVIYLVIVWSVLLGLMFQNKDLFNQIKYVCLFLGLLFSLRTLSFSTLLLFSTIPGFREKLK